ncbi:MAG: hypothetical protein KGY66_02355 [Candidatus Thermoplasmatota archaeon]|nr:hypothetical protein [Candidatus Thermoplasmatota archaeon]MBS3789737.1 hypothetical protein [Candidatus Thermoplasmatota archaeon]
MDAKKFTVSVSMLLLLSMSLLAGVQVSEGARESPRIDPRVVEGPDELFVNETETYRIEIDGFFLANGKKVEANEADNWSLTTESNLQTTIEPLEQESTDSNIFNVTVTVHEEGKGHLNFIAYCSKNGQVFYSEREFSIVSEKPESTSVRIKNPTDTHIEEMRVGLYIDGNLKTTQTLSDMGPEEERQITFQWSKRGIEPGEHTIEIWADYSSAENEDFNKQSMIMSRTFQVEEETSNLIYAGIIVAVMGAGSLIFFWYRRRRKKRRRPW